MTITTRVLALVPLLASIAFAQTDAVSADRTSPLAVETNPFLIGQAPDWVDRTHVVWGEPFSRDEGNDGEGNIYRSTLDGGDKVCLTCGLDGPNQVPVVQPH